MAGTGTSRKLSFALLTTTLVFGAAELGLRAAGWPPPQQGFAHKEVYWVTDPRLDAQAFPHNEESTTFPVSTDDNGLRFPLHSVDKPGGAHRLMTLGCSTTFGWGVADRASYPARLEALAREAGYGRTEVINGGQPGYTSFQGLWLWDDTLKHYDPDVVLIGYVVQDARKAAYTDQSQAVLQGDARFLKDHLLYRLRTYTGLRSLMGVVQLRAKERAEGGAAGVYRVPPADYRANLLALIDRVQRRGATPVLFGYPLERSGYTAEHRGLLAEIAAETGVALLDPQAQMEAASQQAALYFPRDKGHANAAGNDQIARWVFDFLQSEQLLGSR